MYVVIIKRDSGEGAADCDKGTVWFSRMRRRRDERLELSQMLVLDPDVDVVRNAQSCFAQEQVREA